MLLGIPSRPAQHFDYRALTVYGQPFQAVRLYHAHVTATDRQICPEGPTTPTTQPLPGITRGRFSHLRVRSPLLTESLLFSLPVGTEMFHFPTFPLPALYIQAGVTRSPKGPGQVSPFGHPRITARLSTPRGLSQIATSFIGSRCQGIHRSLLETCHHNMSQKNRPEPKPGPDQIGDPHTPKECTDLRCSRPLCSSQNTTGTHPPPTQGIRQARETSPPATRKQPAGTVPQDPTARTPPTTANHGVPNPRKSRTNPSRPRQQALSTFHP